MTEEQLSSAAVISAALAPNAKLDLEGWPRWILEALAIQPGTAMPTANPVTAVAPVRVDPASVRVLRRVPPRS